MDFKICRLCGESGATANIFSLNKEFPISALILYCCPRLSIAEGDGLPAHVCRSCEEELDSAHRFVQKCEATEQKLRLVARTVREPGPDHGDRKPKLEEIKLEVTCAGDRDGHDEDDREEYATFGHKQEVEIKSEGQEVRAKKSKSVSKRGWRRAALAGHAAPAHAAPAHAAPAHEAAAHEAAAHEAAAAHKAATHACARCDKRYKDRGSLKRHADRHHSSGVRERNFVCESCGKKFFTKNDVKIHLRTHTGEAPYACPECARRFSQAGALLRHRRRHAGQRPHACAAAACRKRFATREGLSHHRLVHSDEKLYSCSICRVPFKYLNNLKKHMVIHTAPNSLVCNHCGRTFNQKGNLKSHIERQHSEKSGHCNVCSKNVPDIEVHMWRHTGQRPLKCELCTSSFFELKSLARHVNYRHKNVDKFVCSREGCGMKFPARSMLEFHTVKLHETGIPFPCDRCTRGFYRKNDLARHKIGTHKERLIPT